MPIFDKVAWVVICVSVVYFSGHIVVALTK